MLQMVDLVRQTTASLIALTGSAVSEIKDLEAQVKPLRVACDKLEHFVK